MRGLQNYIEKDIMDIETIRPVDLEQLYGKGFDYVDLNGFAQVDNLYRLMTELDFDSARADTDGLYGPDGNAESVPNCIAFETIKEAPREVYQFWGMVHESPLLRHYTSKRGPFLMEPSLVKYYKGQGLAPHNDLQSAPAELNLALCLNKEWKPEHGGLLRFTRNEVLCGEVEPVYGRLVVILNDPPFFKHAVTEVSSVRYSALCRFGGRRSDPT